METVGVLRVARERGREQGQREVLPDPQWDRHGSHAFQALFWPSGVFFSPDWFLQESSVRLTGVIKREEEK